MGLMLFLTISLLKTNEIPGQLLKRFSLMFVQSSYLKHRIEAAKTAELGACAYGKTTG